MIDSKCSVVGPTVICLFLPFSLREYVTVVSSKTAQWFTSGRLVIVFSCVTTDYAIRISMHNPGNPYSIHNIQLIKGFKARL